MVVLEYVFKDYYQNEVKLSFQEQPFSKTPKHVWIICKYKDKWLLTEHRSRGLEFPGGKVEKGETAEKAAVREVMEETGGVVNKLYYIAQYFVTGRNGTIIKNVYFAPIETLKEQPTYYETNGPVLLDDIPENIKEKKRFSFMMKDDVLSRCLRYVEKHY
ncbi:RNA deprotection pyrophosphohydrolase [Pseudogracilibacillus sp. SO30301A]|uniref:RNA deprotection pyrophosphohydrolase n=1 Tax=Pseudogracilibacillus sp. SO30301A TaxID=3098291 RepID=UPI00300E1281